MAKVKWLKHHPASGCFVGHIEEIKDAKRLSDLEEGGFVRSLTKEEENALNKEKTESATGK